MKTKIKCKIKPYIQPFERKLAIAELRALAGSAPRPLSGLEDEALDFEVTSTVSANNLAKSLVYWEYVCDSKKRFTSQVLREATVNIVRNGIPFDQLKKLVPFGSDVPLPNRRTLRYGTHGIHEYRGKFFPQLVRALVNISNIPQHSVVADPMCGSGTTLVEAILSGHKGIGMDLNPLSTLITKTKCSLFSVAPQSLLHEYQSVREHLLSGLSLHSVAQLPHSTSSYSSDQKYLSGWFSEQVLRDLNLITNTVNSLTHGAIRDLMLLSLSNIIRKVSWQKDNDLRVRKEIRTDDDIDPIKEFLEEMGRTVRTILAFLYQNQQSPIGTFAVEEGDVREITTLWQQWLGKVDLIITSPPYATALPYLDTDRLSLCYLALLPRPEHRKRDLLMIGNREITDQLRKYYLSLFNDARQMLPDSVIQVIERIEHLNSKSNVGFRRKNLPALLSKYFLDMLQVFNNIVNLLKLGAPAYIVVGNNHTIAGGIRVEIETANLLTDIGKSVGLEFERLIPMEMIASRNISKKNAVASEAILSFRRVT